MRHVNYVLKPGTIDSAKAKDKRYDLTDGGRLVLEVMPSGSKTWRFKYHLNGKREKVTIARLRRHHQAIPARIGADDHSFQTMTLRALPS